MKEKVLHACKYIDYFLFLPFFPDLGVRGVEGDRTDSLSLEAILSVPALEGGASPLAAFGAAGEGEALAAGTVDPGGGKL